MDAKTIGRKWLAVAVPLGVGALVASVNAALECLHSDWQAGPTAVWVTDRDADELVGLDADLFVAQRIPVRSPIEVESDGNGGCWVVNASEGDPLGAHRLLHFSPAGAVLESHALDGFGDLSSLVGGTGQINGQRDALVTEFLVDEPERAWWFRAQRKPLLLGEQEGLVALAGSDQRVLLASETALWQVKLDDPNLTQIPFIVDFDPNDTNLFGKPELGPVGDLAPSSSDSPGGWLLLEIGFPGRLVSLNEIGQVLWTAPTGLAALHMATVSTPNQASNTQSQSIWIADSTEPRLRRFGPQGQLELDLSAPTAGMDRATLWSDPRSNSPQPGVLAVTPGALLHWNGFGQAQPGQGGFNFLVDVAPAY